MPQVSRTSVGSSSSRKVKLLIGERWQRSRSAMSLAREPRDLAMNERIFWALAWRVLWRTVSRVSRIESSNLPVRTALLSRFLGEIIKKKPNTCTLSRLQGESEEVPFQYMRECKFRGIWRPTRHVESMEVDTGRIESAGPNPRCQDRGSNPRCQDMLMRLPRQRSTSISNFSVQV